MALDLDISRVRSVKGSSERYHLEVSAFDLEDENWSLAKPLVIDAEISHEKQFLQMNGKLATAVKGVCSRCLKPVETPVECSFAEQLLYAKDISLFSHLAVGEVEEKYFIYDNDTEDNTVIIKINGEEIIYEFKG